jgi:hypothetical protein
MEIITIDSSDSESDEYFKISNYIHQIRFNVPITPSRTANRAPPRNANRAPPRNANRAPPRTANRAPPRTANRSISRNAVRPIITPATIAPYLLSNRAPPRNATANRAPRPRIIIPPPPRIATSNVVPPRNPTANQIPPNIIKESPTKIEDDEELDFKVDMECKVCYLKIIDVVMIPCGHLVACLGCAQKLKVNNMNHLKCPYCRKLSSFKKVFTV